MWTFGTNSFSPRGWINVVPLNVEEGSGVRERVSYANVMATVAMFLALGGSAYAAAKITGKDIRDGTITTADIKDGSLRQRDFRAGELRAGLQAPKGDKGDAGTPGVRGDP